jgi:Na+(H+)/acetate symporter ActP
VELWAKDGWSVCSRPAGVVYAGCIFASLAAYAYVNRIAPVAVSVSVIILALVLAAFACLAGTSGQTWTDPSNALAVLLIACAFLLDGFFIAGARTFGPTEVSRCRGNRPIVEYLLFLLLDRRPFDRGQASGEDVV